MICFFLHVLVLFSIEDGSSQALVLRKLERLCNSPC